MSLTRHPGTTHALALVIALCVVSFPACAKYSGTTGGPNDLYRVATATDLVASGGRREDYDKHVILVEDIDLDLKKGQVSRVCHLVRMSRQPTA